MIVLRGNRGPAPLSEHLRQSQARTGPAIRTLGFAVGGNGPLAAARTGCSPSFQANTYPDASDGGVDDNRRRRS